MPVQGLGDGVPRSGFGIGPTVGPFISLSTIVLLIIYIKSTYTYIYIYM